MRGTGKEPLASPVRLPNHTSDLPAKQLLVLLHNQASQTMRQLNIQRTNPCSQTSAATRYELVSACIVVSLVTLSPLVRHAQVGLGVLRSTHLHFFLPLSVPHRMPMIWETRNFGSEDGLRGMEALTGDGQTTIPGLD